MAKEKSPTKKPKRRKNLVQTPEQQELTTIANIPFELYSKEEECLVSIQKILKEMYVNVESVFNSGRKSK